MPRPCGGCNRVDLTKPYDAQSMCRFCYLYHTDEKYRKAFDGESIQPPPSSPPPTLAKMLQSFISANVVELAFRATGGKAPTYSEIEFRRNHCNACDQHDSETDSCKICGCSLGAKWLPPIPLGKLEMSTQECPRHLWGPVGGAEPKGCGGCGAPQPCVNCGGPPLGAGLPPPRQAEG